MKFEDHFYQFYVHLVWSRNYELNRIKYLVPILYIIDLVRSNNFSWFVYATCKLVLYFWLIQHLS